MGFTAFAIAPSQNKDGKHDASGAFHPGAQKFAKAYNCNWRTFDNSGSSSATRKEFLKTIETFCPGNCDLFAYFGHGYTNGLGSAHIGESQLTDFLKVLEPKLANVSVVVLYACSSGKAGGFTGKMRERLGGDKWIYGHTTVGHSFMNPDVSEEYAGNSPSFKLLFPSGDDLRSPWASALKYTDLWLRFPYLYNDALVAECSAHRLRGTWEVNFSGDIYHYKFEDPYEVWNINSGRDIDAPPDGKVKAYLMPNKKTVVDEGTWKVTDRVHIDWASGWTENWPLPLHVAAQSGMSEGVMLTAKRLSHDHGGKLQG